MGQVRLYYRLTVIPFNPCAESVGHGPAEILPYLPEQFELLIIRGARFWRTTIKF